MPFGKIRSFNLSPFVFFALAIFAALPFCAQAQTVSSLAATRITRPIDNGVRVTLGGTVHPLARGANDRGLAPDGLPLERLQILLKRSDAQEAALKQAIADMHTPGSASYHQWLTPAQFGQQYGPSDADINTIENWLRTQGFAISGLSPGREVLEVSGSVANFRSAFHTDIHQYQVNGQRHFANSGDPQIPAALAPVFGGFVSLNNFQKKSHAKPLGHATYNPTTHTGSHQGSSDWTVTDGSGVDYVLSPSDYAVQYDLNPLYTAGTNGSGQTIAIINDSNIDVARVNQFRTLFGLSANPPQVIIDGNDPGVDGNYNPDGPNGDSVEAYLDVEWAGAVAPSATVDLVIGADTNLETGLYLALEHAVDTNLAPVISISFGECEVVLGSDNQFLNALYQQAAAQGQTVLVSTGDSGSAGCDNPDTQVYAVEGQAVSGFASSPYVVAVGGTDFYYSQYAAGGTALTSQLATYWNPAPSNTTATKSILGVVPEQPWNDSQYGLNIFNAYALSGETTISGGGGGPSTCSSATTSGTTSVCVPYAKPTWQTGTGVPADNVRDIPDLSLFAANGLNGSYYPICATDGDCQPVSVGGEVQIFGVGGTSASTPAFAGIMAMINQKYGRQGQADFVLYPLAAQYPAAFHDVAVGTNTMPCLYSATAGSDSINCIAGPSPLTLPTGIVEGEIGSGTTAYYNTTAGYDLATGLGTLDANVMLADWNKVTLKSSATTMTPSSSSFTHGTSVTFSGNVTGTGTPTGAVSLMTDSTEMSEQSQTIFALSSGTYSGSVNYMPGGTYNVWGAYGGDGVNGGSTSAKTKITVTPENSGIFFIMTAVVNGSVGIVTSPSAPNYTATVIPYGYDLSLIGLAAPSSQLTAYENCLTTANVTCPVFTPPTGTISFSDNGTTLNVAEINSEGDAEFSSPFSVGTHSVTANYSGDNSYNSSSGGTTPQTFTIGKDTPTVGAGASNLSAVVAGGQPTVLNFFAENSINATTPVVAPTGTITVTSTGVSGCSNFNGAYTLQPVFAASVGSYGVASKVVAANSITGACTVSLAYGGDSNYNATTTSGSLQFAAAQSLQPSTTTATASATTTSATAAINVTTVVSGVSGHPAPTGSVTFYASTLNIGSFTLASSTGTSVTTVTPLNSESLLQGTNLISVQYSGDGNYLPSVVTLNIYNGEADFSIIPATSIVAMPASNVATDTIYAASQYGFAGAVSYTCSPPTGVTCTLTPTSNTLTSGGTGSTSLSLNTNGVTATGNYNVLVTATDPTGFYIHTLSITADVTSLPVTGFGLTNSGTITLATQGATGTATITVTPSGSFTGSVALNCAVTTTPTSATKPVTCSVSSPVSITGTTAGTATLTINSSASALGDRPLERYFAGAGGVALAALVFFGIPRRRHGWRGLFVLLLLTGAMLMGMSGCGSGSSSSNQTVTPPSTTSSTGTTLGSYTVTVTGTSGSITTITAVTVIVN